MNFTITIQWKNTNLAKKSKAVIVGEISIEDVTQCKKINDDL